MSNQGTPLKLTDINVIYTNNCYLTTYERCYLLLLKFLPSIQAPSQNSIELVLPASLYKLRKPSRYDNDLQSLSFDCVLREYYELPNIEVLNDWVVLLESVLNGLYTPDCHQNLLIEAYIIQMTLAFFGEADNDNQLSLSILERITAFANNSPVTSPELTIAIHTWYGILSESKLFVECEQSYAIALLVLHKLYGDPRGRGGNGTPWELFITWRLSILSRLQGKIHDAEYSEELYDATLITLRDNPMNVHLKSHYIYNDPFKAYESSASVHQQNELSHLSHKPNSKTLQASEHPFSYWTNHLVFDETSSKIDTINSTLQKTPQLLKWMISYLPTAQSTGTMWDTAYLKDFFISIMQSSFNNAMSASSVSSFSGDRGKDKSVLGLDVSMKGSAMRYDRKDKRFNPGGNLVQIFEKDSSTFSKKDVNGTIYSWGQNDKGQVGTPICSIEDLNLGTKHRMRIYYPKRIMTLKDTIILSVTCGHLHSMAITLNGQLLAWGDNKWSQLGLGPKAPVEIYVPTLVTGIRDVINVALFLFYLPILII